MMFLFKRVIFRFQPIVFGGVKHILLQHIFDMHHPGTCPSKNLIRIIFKDNRMLNFDEANSMYYQHHTKKDIKCSSVPIFISFQVVYSSNDFVSSNLIAFLGGGVSKGRG